MMKFARGMNRLRVIKWLVMNCEPAREPTVRSTVFPAAKTDEISGLETLDARALHGKYPALLADIPPECQVCGVLRAVVAYRLQEKHYGICLTEPVREWLVAEEKDARLLDKERGVGANARLVRLWRGVRYEAVVREDGKYEYDGNLRRPALSELLKDIAESKVDIVVVYKIDRLSRSLTDFGKISRIFEQHGVSFVSVTQQIDTSSAFGRMMRNILMSFAQFEHEISADRVRDKLYQSRKLGLSPTKMRLSPKAIRLAERAKRVSREAVARARAPGSIQGMCTGRTRTMPA